MNNNTGTHEIDGAVKIISLWKFKFLYLIKRILGFLIHTIFEIKYLGPWRNFIIRKYIEKSGNEPFQFSTFNEIDLKPPEQIAEEVSQSGYSIAGRLSESSVKEILQHCEEIGYLEKTKTIKTNIVDPHLGIPIVNEVLRSQAIYECAKEYLGVEPILYDSVLWLRKDETDIEAQNCVRVFHYDLTDFKAVTVFIYLTDVDQHSSPHSLIKNSHKTPLYKRMFCKLMPSAKAKALYPEDILTICGSPGDIIFEDLLCYHKRSFGNKKRIALKGHYTIKRKRSSKFERLRKFIKLY